MKKTLLATAIAGSAFAASGAQAATVYNQDGTKLDIYGNIQLVYSSVKEEDNGNVETRDQIEDNGTTIGFEAEHQVYNGLTGYMKLELDGFSADEMKVSGRGDGDTAYIGLRGNFGDARVGSFDSLIDDWIQDPVSNNEYFDLSDSNTFKGAPGDEDIVVGDPEGDKLSYTSPIWGGFQFALGTQYKGDAEDENLQDSGTASFFGGLKYTAGGFSVAAVYDDLGIYDVDDYEYVTGSTLVVSQEVDENNVPTGRDIAVAETTSVTVDDDLGDQYGMTFQYQWNTLRVALKYERFESENDALEDVDFYALGARYGYGDGLGDIYGAYQYVDYGGSGFLDRASELNRDRKDEGDNDGQNSRNEFTGGVTYNISEAMYTYAEGVWRDNDSNVGDGYAVGLTYLF